MKNKVCVITGSNSGTGYETALALAKNDWQVIMICRNLERGKNAQNEVINRSRNQNVDLIICDLVEMNQVVEAANLIKEKYEKIDVLINNAGGLTPKRIENSQGVEMQFAGNYLGHALLTELLLPQLKKAAPSRIINVSSGAHSSGKIHLKDINLKNNYSTWRAYSQSKLAQLLSTYKLARELKSFNITVNALHPGAVKSGLTRGVPNIGQKIAPVIYKLIGISAEKGAETTLYLATSSKVEGVTGKYFVNCKEKKSSKLSYDKTLQFKLYQETENMLKSFYRQS